MAYRFINAMELGHKLARTIVWNSKISYREALSIGLKAAWKIKRGDRFTYQEIIDFDYPEGKFDISTAPMLASETYQLSSTRMGYLCIFLAPPLNYDPNSLNVGHLKSIDNSKSKYASL